MQALQVIAVALAAALAALIVATSSWAVNFFDGARAPEGFYFLSYTSLFSSARLTNDQGNTAVAHTGYWRFDETLRVSYYSPELVVTALMPLGAVRVDFRNEASYGLGDALLGGGYFLPIQSVDILPMLFIKLPTGRYDSGKAINYGSNQYDLRLAVFIYKALGDLSVDAAARYYWRFQNEDTRTTPGNELSLELLPGYKLTPEFKVGPSFRYIVSGNSESDGQSIPGSARATFSAGCEFYYRINKLAVTLTYLYDVYAKNTYQGHFLQLKTLYSF